MGVTTESAGAELEERVVAFLAGTDGRLLNATFEAVAEALGADLSETAVACQGLHAAGRVRRGGAGHYCLREAGAPRPDTNHEATPAPVLPGGEPHGTPSAADYSVFVRNKSQSASDGGFAPLWLPDALFDFQRALVEWALRKGRAAVFADCGLGKTPMQLAWAENVVRKTNRPALILTPLAVSAQTVREAEKFGVDCRRVAPGGAVDGARVYVTNYERLHHLDPGDFAGVACDESSILKSYSGETKKAVTRFTNKTEFRSLWTATAAPNDYIELGTSSEALGGLGYTDMLSRFFKQSDRKGSRIEDVKASRADRDMGAMATGGNHFGKLSFRVSQQIGQWRMKGHAVTPFWRWVASWARACRKPSDLGAFDDARFVLPPLIENEHVVKPRRPDDGMLFTMPAFGLQEEREERKRTLQERCEFVAGLVNHDRPAAVWCHMNPEGDLLEELIAGAVQVSGADADEAKEEAYAAFASGEARVLVTKPKIGAWGLNWQHCSDVVTFASHSYEQYYQSVRRCWRFGQTRPVTVDVVSTDGETRVRDSMIRKSRAADLMFAELVKYMRDASGVSLSVSDEKAIEVPTWA
jgi:hypothetical protein